MHELSLCEDVLSLLQETAIAQGFTQVLTVHLEIGELVNVEVDAMYFCFDEVMKDTLADGAVCHIQIIKGRARCMHCGHVFETSQRFGVCPECEHPHFEMIEGDKLLIKSLEVD